MRLTRPFNRNLVAMFFRFKINNIEYEIVDYKIEGPPYTEYWKIVSVEDRSKFFWHEKNSLDAKILLNKEDNKHLIYEM